MGGAVTGGGTAASMAAIIAAREAARKRQEEEDMTGYDKDDMDGWEFKIVRSATGKFKKYEEVRKVCDEEAKAGWELLEKFDDYRIRFKRRVEKRAGDQFLNADPYRTNTGLSSNVLGLTIAGIIIFLAGMAGLLFILIGRH
nr:hypothetical protein [candidate division Zixibacteria bacterium]